MTRRNMDIVLGATGQVGSGVAKGLLKKGREVRAVVRNGAKARELEKMGAEIAVADYLDREALERAFHGGGTAFLLTPEDPWSEHHIDDVRVMLGNYRESVQASGVNKIVGLSTMGAQLGPGSGDLYASYLLERAFWGLDVEQVFVRPTYYYSNWTGYLDLVKAQGILPTLFPPEMKLSMVSPLDISAYLAEAMVRDAPQERVAEVLGPREYSSLGIVKTFEDVLGRDVALQPIPPNEWGRMLTRAGFTADGIEDLTLMTKAVIDGRTKGERPDPVHLPTDFRTYLVNRLRTA